ncbi:MAG: ABC transporter ATP-binding protein [Chloroflexota bacterium]
MTEQLQEGDAVTLDGVSFRYGKLLALDHISLHIGTGVTALLGPNGAGKSTLLRLLVGLTAPSTGDLQFRLADDPRSARERNRFIGFAPQTLDYYPNYSVRDFLRYVAWLKRVPKPTLQDCITDALASTDLTELATRKLRALSGGMIRRLAVAQALVNRPRLLVLDEPAAGLDPAQRIDMRAILRDIGVGRSLVISTHHVDDLVALADRVIVLNAGRVTFTGNVNELSALASKGTFGDTDLERAYSAALGGNGPASGR